MKFSGPDLVPGKFEVNATVVSKNVFSKDVLELAATRLLAAWPMLCFRVLVRAERVPAQTAESQSQAVADNFDTVKQIHA